MRSKVHLFANDAILYLTITSEDYCRLFQNDLDALQKWETTWRVKFNDTKYEVLRISRSKTLIQHTYYLHGTPLREVDQAKYLGVWFSKDLKWNQHIDEITAKANHTLGFLKRNLWVNSSTLKAKAYKVFVRLQVEYCSSVWEPRPGVEKNGSYKIGRIQRRAAQWCSLRQYNLGSI